MFSIVAAYAACAVIWGTTWLAIRICIGPGGYDTLLALVLRFAIASAILLPIAWRVNRWPTRRQWGFLIIAGILDAVAYTMVYIGEQDLSGGLAAVIYGTQPFILAAVLGLTKMEKIWPSDVAGAAVSLVGVAVLFLGKLQLSIHQAMGVLLVLGSVVCSTCYSALVKRTASDVHAVTSTSIFLSVTALCLTPLAVLRGGALSWPDRWQASAALLYLAIAGSVIAFVLYFWLLQRVSMKAMSALVFLFPIIALVADAIGEQRSVFTMREFVAVVVILLGMTIGYLGIRQRALAAKR
jgi:drug/metabolite transporter (DMT)-like permease